MAVMEAVMDIYKMTFERDAEHFRAKAKDGEQTNGHMPTEVGAPVHGGDGQRSEKVLQE